MKIIELKSQNIKNIRAIEITPEGNAVVLNGPNGAGKSAVLDSLMLALTGKKVEEPIRKGQERAEVTVNLGEYKVKKVWTHAGERLEVTNAGGQAYKSPQTLLNKILGELSFDPLAFKGMKANERRELLLKVVGLDFSESDAKREGLYNERTLKNREAKRLEAQIGGIEKSEENLPEKEISIADEMNKIGELERRKLDYDEFLKNRDELNRHIGLNVGKISECETEIKRLQEEILTHNQNIYSAKKRISEMAEPVEITDEQIAEAKKNVEKVEATNAKIREALKYSDLKKQLLESNGGADWLSGEIERLDNEKANKIEACKFPVTGLSVNDETVLFNEIPFKQLSTGEQVGISTAIAMALNPKLKIILVREGSLLDKNGLKAIIEMAKKKDYQIWLEYVGEGEIGIHIEDGQIVGKEK